MSYKFGVNQERLKDVVKVKDQSAKLEIDPRELTYEQEGDYSISMNIDLSNGARNSSKLYITVLCP